MASKKDGVTYVGVTSDLIKRVYEHRESVIPDSFSSKYFVKKLVYYEAYDDIECAITREKQIKKWNRQWKINLIEKDNPEWQDLYNTILH
jgi:putative endonuclease